MKSNFIFHKNNLGDETQHDQQVNAILMRRRRCSPFNIGRDRHLHRKVIRCYPRGYAFYRLALLEALK